MSLYGFTWGPALIERSAVIERPPRGTWRVLSITTGTPSQDLEIYISPTGRSVRVFKNHHELKATET